MNRRHLLPMLMLAIPTLASGDSRLRTDEANAIVSRLKRKGFQTARIVVQE